tara:strand:- start:9037 stop:9483 length:447 start_codon:yes stop_codon:yes gene_type:complete
MANTIGDWTTVTGDLSENGVKHQCLITFDASSAKQTTPPFQWPVMGDFTVIVTCFDDGVVADADEQINMDINGSVTGIGVVGAGSNEWVELDGKDSIVTDAGGGTHVGIHVYDFDSKGLMPYLNISLDPVSSNSSREYRITVTPHHMV